MTQRIQLLPRRAPAPVAPVVTEQPNRIMWCDGDDCKTYTPHALNWSKDRYVCSCGTENVYVVNAAAEECKAIALRETAEAQERFEKWIEEILKG